MKSFGGQALSGPVMDMSHGHGMGWLGLGRMQLNFDDEIFVHIFPVRVLVIARFLVSWSKCGRCLITVFCQQSGELKLLFGDFVQLQLGRLS